MEVHWSLPCCELVGCSDATLRTYAVQEGLWSVDQVRACFSWSDRWRFRLPEPIEHRELALSRAVHDNIGEGVWESLIDDTTSRSLRPSKGVLLRFFSFVVSLYLARMSS